MLFARDRSQLLIVDVQERLAPAMYEASTLAGQCAKLAAIAGIVQVPVTVSEQYPKGIGPTVAQVRDACAMQTAFLDKMTFSCMRDQAIARRIADLKMRGRDQLLVCGIESHVCVLQTAMEFSAAGFHVGVVADAVSSRAAFSKETALARMSAIGISIVTVEMAAFEWLEKAGTAEFKAAMALIK